MRERARLKSSVIVWDNGSCPALRNWLQNEYKPDVLILSENIGKAAARANIIRMAEDEKIIAYSDDDMYFENDWLAPQVELLQYFPNVAAVTGYPVRTAFRWGTQNTMEWARKNATIKIGRILPEQWENDFAVSIGRDIVTHKEASAKDNDYLIEYKGKSVFGTAHHCQFIGFAKTLKRAIVLDGMAMGDEKVFDVALDSIGLRLATIKRLTRHIGNVMF